MGKMFNRFKQDKRQIAFAIFLVINSALLVFLWKMNLLQHETMDDYYMASYFSGLYGKYDSFDLFNNVIYGGILSMLYKYIPVVNWMNLGYIVVGYFSYNIVAFLVINRIKSIWLGTVLSFSYLLATYSYIYEYMNFSKIALVATIAGMLLLYYWYDCERTKAITFVLAIALILWGSWIRFEAAIITLAYGAIFVVSFIRKNKIRAKRIVATCCVLAAVILSWGINKVAYNTPEWQETATRSQLLLGPRDYNTLPEEMWDQIDWDYVGITPEDLRFALGWQMGDKNVFSVDALTRLSEYEVQRDTGLSYFQDVLAKTLENCNAHNIFILALLLAMLALVIADDYWIEVILTTAIMSAESIFLVYNGRYPERVSVIPWITAICVILYYMGSSQNSIEYADDKNGKFTKAGVSAVAIIATYSLISGGLLFSEKRIVEYVDAAEFGSFLDNIDTTESDDLYIVNYTNPTFTAYTLFDIPDSKLLQDCVLDAGCMSMYPDVYEKTERFGSANSAYEAMIKSDHVYLIDERYFWEKRDFIRRHYCPECDVAWVYSQGDADAYSYTKPMEVDASGDIADWSIDEIKASDSKDRFWEIRGRLQANNVNNDIYYLNIESGDKNISYEIRVAGNQFFVGVPMDTWNDAGEVKINIISKGSNGIIGDDAIVEYEF